MLRFTEYDLGQLENIMRAMRNGSYTLTGMEALAFSDCMRWASRLQETIKAELTAAALAQQKKNPLEGAVVTTPSSEGPIKSNLEAEPAAPQPAKKKK